MTAQTILPANSVVDSGFNVDNSARFDGSSYLHRTPSATGNPKKWTYSVWVKMAQVNPGYFLAAGSGTQSKFIFGAYGGADIDIITYTGYVILMNTARLFRDQSAWYHMVLAVDTTQSAAANGVKLYINGVLETLTLGSVGSENGYTQDTSLRVGTNNEPIHIGRDINDSGHWKGYMAECALVNDAQLAPTSFGEFDEDSGIWKPIDISGLTFGTNGFHLDFKDSSALGNDVSGVGDFTLVNLAAVDQSTDTCTNNFATFNALTTSLQSGGVVAYSEGNTKIVTAYSNTNYLRYPQAYTTLGVTSGKWYAEFKIGAIGSASVGIANTGEFGSDGTTNPYAGYAASGAVYTNGGEYRANNSSTGSQGTYTEDDIIGCALDMDNLAVYWHKNGTYINSGDPTSGSSKTGARAVVAPTTAGGFYVFTAGADNTGIATIEINLGSPSYAISSGNADARGHGNFEYAVPSGYFALCTKNLAEFG